MDSLDGRQFCNAPLVQHALHGPNQHLVLRCLFHENLRLYILLRYRGSNGAPYITAQLSWSIGRNLFSFIFSLSSLVKLIFRF